MGLLLWGQQLLLIYLNIQAGANALGPLTLSTRGAVRKVGEGLSVICTVANEDRRVSLEWTLNKLPLNETREYSHRSAGQFLLEQTLVLGPLRVEDSGEYSCQAVSMTASLNESFWLRVVEKGYVVLSVDGPWELQLSKGETLQMKVAIDSYPRETQRQWLRNGTVMLDHGSGDLCNNETSDTCDGRVIHRVSPEDGGIYTFVARNEDNETSVDFFVHVNGSGLERPVVIQSVVKLSGKENNFFEVTLTLSVFFVFLSSLFIVFLYKHKQKPHYEIRWKIISSVNAETNEYIYIDPSTLPYEPVRWELDPSLLTLGKTIGCGEFGKVVEAKAHGIPHQGSVTRVAVKMLKPRAHHAHKEALMSELKIMSHLGRHLNIVNLLGACTREDPILVITEYCNYGDLLNYLRRKWHILNSGNNDDATNYQNLTIARRMESTQVAVGIEEYSLKAALMNQAERGFIHGHKGWDASSEEEREAIASDDSTPFGVDNLLSFSEQVASGMAFLAHKNISRERSDSAFSLSPGLNEWWNNDNTGRSVNIYTGETKAAGRVAGHLPRSVSWPTFTELAPSLLKATQGIFVFFQCIHRDLAARNVLVTHGRVAKICDFGLARDVQTDPNYVVKGNVPLPVKWMSPESMFHGLYTVQSDVWSYGVLLWEIFSFGEAPYPGMAVDDKFYRLICDGYCMQPPPRCPPQVREVMHRCWSHAPLERPTFEAILAELRPASNDDKIDKGEEVGWEPSSVPSEHSSLAC
uniref:receptor protein-tyrosine kinase n=1 Tax=Petromyzon marinus TaxID=7757 RepID=A0AAJ7XFI4_PETMA|nr:mast/stem cell growth factor receptor kita-like [Petromyzon marinus]